VTIRTARSFSSGGYRLCESPGMTPTFPRFEVSGHAGAVQWVGANEALVARTGQLVDELAPFPPSVVRSARGVRASLVGAMALAVRRTWEGLVVAPGEPHSTGASESLP
jgi:hypothetical protein